MMEVNITNPEHTATHATYKIFCSWWRIMESGAYCGYTVHNVYLLDREKKQLMLVFSMPIWFMQQHGSK